MWPEEIFGSENSKEKCEQKGLASEWWEGAMAARYYGVPLFVYFFPLDSVSLAGKQNNRQNRPL